ncbi:hypothetical protein MKX01_014277 [Papaver californicum]|nr:hypothetical protein MKX01_014277 [Papaver californicum]
MNQLAGGDIAYNNNSHPFRNFFPNKPPSKFMDTTTTKFRGSGFTMNLINSSDHHHQQEKRAVVDEMDFFSSDKNRVREYDQNKGAKDMMIKKEDSHGGSSSRFSHDVNTGLNLLTANTLSDQSTVDDDGISPNADDKRSKDELEALQQDLARMNSENQKLKGMLNQVTSNYNTLQMQLVVLMQQKNPKIETSQDHEMVNVTKHEENRVNEVIPRQFMDLGLATTNTEVDELSHSSSEGKSRDRSRTPTNTNVEESSLQKKEMVLFDHQEKSELGSSRDNDESLEDHPSQGWVPNKIPKLNSPLKNVESQQQQQPVEATMRKPRVSVRARSEAPMITDGCQWRKYGQKMAKGNPCPRAYYRCTMAAACPVRKQVQRCAEDRTILITTYEGTHNHPLPPAAMAMASTTSTAATMLLSGSMSSADGLMDSNFLTRTLLPCSSSMATISASAPFPTVTLDLTQSPNNPLQFQRPATQFHVPFMNQPPSQGFGSQPTAQPQFPQLFGQSPYNQSKFSGLQMSSQNGDQAHHINNHQSPPRQQQQQAQPNSLADTVSAATAAITADPNFTAALAAAISSIMSGGGQQTMNNNSSSCNTASNTNNSTD